MSNRPTGPFRKIVNVEPRVIGKRVTLKLECGHVKYQKGSDSIPLRTRCIDCLYHEPPR
jgi:hypothetical protein